MFGSVAIMTDISTVRVSKHGHRLLREAVRSLPLEVLKTQTDVALSNPSPTALWAWSRLDGLQRHLQPQPFRDSWRLKLGTSCLQHVLWAVFPWWTLPMRYCSQRLPQEPLRRGHGARLQVQAILGHRACPCKRRRSEASRWHLEGFRFLRKIFGHIFFFTAMYALSQWVISAGIFFLPQKTNNKTNHSTFSHQLQAAACMLLESRAARNDRYIFLCVDTPFFSTIKRKMNWKQIQRYKSPQSLRSEMGEAPCWEIPREAWCCLCFP